MSRSGGDAIDKATREAQQKMSFGEWCARSIFPSVAWKESIETISDEDVARVYPYFNDRLFYCRRSKNWYRLNEHNVYILMNDDIELRTGFTRIADAVSLYTQHLKNEFDASFMGNGSVTDNVKSSEKLVYLIKNCDKLYKNLKSSSFKDHVIKELPSYYAHDDLYSLLDSKGNLFAFNNKVVDLDLGYVRPIFVDDYISTTTGYDYPETVDSEALQFLNDTLNSIHPTKEDVDYMCECIAYCLHGFKKRHDYFFAWVGKGGNGKGTMSILIMDSFGGYYKPMSIEYFTSVRKGSNSASPELANKKGVRVVISTEADEDSKYQTSKIKELSDVLEVRALYKNPVSFTPQFGLIIQSNDDPQFTTCDKGIIRRYRGQKFPYQFVKDPKTPFEKQIDPNLKYKLSDPKVRDAFILMLINVFKKKLSKGQPIDMPKDAKDYTQGVADENDVLTRFLFDNYNVTHSNFDKVDKVSVHNAFRDRTGRKLPNGIERKIVEILKSTVDKTKNPDFDPKNKRNYIGISRLKEDEI